MVNKIANDDYWSHYSNLQHVKHELIKNYLGGWFPKLLQGGWKRILFIDTHAGRGIHSNEKMNLGSPLVALETLINHQVRDRILQKGEVSFYFIEENIENLKSLEGERGIVNCCVLEKFPKRRILGGFRL